MIALPPRMHSFCCHACHGWAPPGSTRVQGGGGATLDACRRPWMWRGWYCSHPQHLRLACHPLELSMSPPPCSSSSWPCSQLGQAVLLFILEGELWAWPRADSLTGQSIRAHVERHGVCTLGRQEVVNLLQEGREEESRNQPAQPTRQTEPQASPRSAVRRHAWASWTPCIQPVWHRSIRTL